MSAWDIAWGVMVISLGTAATLVLLGWAADLLWTLWRRIRP